MQPNERLRKARIEAGYKTSADFARAHNLPEGTYRSHETGIRGLTRHTAIAYAGLLNVSVEWLLTGNGEGYPIELSDSETPAFIYGRKPESAKVSPKKTLEKHLHKLAYPIAKAALEEKWGAHSPFYDDSKINDLAWQMVEIATNMELSDEQINIQLAEWIMTWDKN